MNKFSPNKNAFTGAVAEIGKGTVYASVYNATTKTWSPYFSLGLNTAISIAFDKTKTDLSHSLEDKNVVFMSLTTAQTVTMTVDFQDFRSDNLKLMLNSDNKTVASSTVTIEQTLPIGSLTKNGLFIPIIGGVDEVTSIEAGVNTLVLDKNYRIQNGSIYIMSVEEQTEAGATNIVTTTTAVELEIMVKNRASEVLEFDSVAQVDVKLYVEMYNVAAPDVLKQYFIHKTNFSVDSLPIKADNDDMLSYTATCVLLPSTEITNPNESPYFKVVTAK